jgi:drug/metabolite transporter (DMT)-like permease
VTTAIDAAPAPDLLAERPPRGALVAAGAAALGAGLSGASVAVNSALRDYPTLTGQAIRYAIGAVALAGWAAARRQRLPRPNRRDLVQLALLAATGLAGFNIFVLAALDHADPAAIGVIVGCVPIVLAVAAPLVRGARPAAATVGAAVVVAGGAAVVQGGGRVSLAGLALAGGALACEVAFTLLALPVVPRLGPLGVSTGACALAAVLLAVTAPLVHGQAAFTAPSGSELAAIVVLGVVVTAVAFLAWYSAVALAGPVRTGLFAGLAPVGTLVTATLMNGHPPHAIDALGTLVVAAGLTLGLKTATPTALTPSTGAGQARPARR